jgi:hypothetical protein
MGYLSVDTLIKVSVIVFFISAVFALLLSKQHKMCNIVSNILNMTASVSGAAAAAVLLAIGAAALLFG